MGGGGWVELGRLARGKSFFQKTLEARRGVFWRGLRVCRWWGWKPEIAGVTEGGAGVVGWVIVRSTGGVQGRQRRGVGAEGGMGQGESQDARQQRGEVQGEPDEGHWGSRIRVRDLLR